MEAFNALYAIQIPGEIVDIPFRWKRETYDNYSAPVQVNRVKPSMEGETICNEIIQGSNASGDLSHADSNNKRLNSRPIIWGITAAVSLFTVYFLISSVTATFAHSIDQFKLVWYWILMLGTGFGIQVGLYTYLREVVRVRKLSGRAGSAVAVAGGLSSTSVVACCAQYMANVMPLMAIPATVVFLGHFQDFFLTIGVLSNIIGTSLILKIIQKHRLYEKKQRALTYVMRLNMDKSFYYVSVFCAFLFMAALYRSI